MQPLTARELNVLLTWASGGTPVGNADKAPVHWTIDKLNDQHCYLRLNESSVDLRVGDRVALGISHPCTTFDKWRWIAVVDEDYRVVDALTTHF